MDNYLKRRIDSYRSSDDNRPLIVDFSYINDLKEISQEYFLLPKRNVLKDIKVNGDVPTISDIYELLNSVNEKECLIFGLGSLLKIFGVETLKDVIHDILGTSYNCKFVVITYQCNKYFDEKIPSYRDKIIALNNIFSTPSSLVFIDEKYSKIVGAENSICNALNAYESETGKKIYVSTKCVKNDFLKSLISIENCKDSYDLICLQDRTCKQLSINLGTQKQWEKLLNNLKDKSIESTIVSSININNVLSTIDNWNDMSDYEKWLLFIYLKLKDIRTGNWAVDYAIEHSQNVSDFLGKIYNSIASISFKEDSYWSKYEDRKTVVKKINDDTEVYKYCFYIKDRNEDSIYYLTDNTDSEKKEIIRIISENSDSFPKQKLIGILQHVYKDLYEYLCDYNYSDDFLSKYFNEYKYLKVINKLSLDFKRIVDDEAVERSFKRRLVYRSELLSELKLDNAKVYFVDALGAEFLSFIERKCQEEGLACKSNCCKSNLPSITAKNTEFKEFFKNKSIEVQDIKDLDNLKHSGKEDYNFDKNKLPIHIIEELKIISECIKDIKLKIKNGIIRKAIIVSDHGATRLAILNNDMVREDVESVGEHGGRVCKVIPGMKLIPNAIVEDGYCILADYNSFKGGRVGKVEMHGGATLEEVTVPIIEIFEKNDSIEFKVLDEIIKVSFKKKALLHFYCSSRLNGVSIKVNGKTYNAETTDGLTFIVEMPDITKSGQYNFEVWQGDTLLSTDNKFIVEKESAKTNDLWG